MAEPATPGAPPLEVAPLEGASTTDGAVMSLVDHLAELRQRVFISAIALAVATVLGFVVAPQVLTVLVAPLGYPLQIITVGGGFFVQLKLALIIGLAISLPVILFELWRFIAPGLTSHERRVARPWLPLAAIFFAVGVVVAYLVMPFALGFLSSFAVPGVSENHWTLEAYFNFVLLLFVAFGAVMEFPIVLVLLNKLHVLSLERLRNSRRYAILAIVIFAVVITPGGDPVSPTIMSIVMYVLYEVTIQILSRTERQAVTPAVEMGG
ncbi:MAG: twin-arginine translocase subunit TatC [Candidatus Limnocylindrales bacterium]